MIHKQYMVMSGDTLDELESAVDELLNDIEANWELYGGLVISAHQFYQPMINEMRT